MRYGLANCGPRRYNDSGHRHRPGATASVNMNLNPMYGVVQNVDAGIGAAQDGRWGDFAEHATEAAVSTALIVLGAKAIVSKYLPRITKASQAATGKVPATTTGPKATAGAKATTGTTGAGQATGATRAGVKATATNTAPRLAQDVTVNPAAPKALSLDRPVGGSASQNAFVQKRIMSLQERGASDIRVNQQQVNINGTRVGVNRPDLQYTLNGRRYYEEFDIPSSTRGPGHQARILANDPDGLVELFTVP